MRGAFVVPPGEPQLLVGGEGEEIWRKNLLKGQWLCSERLGIGGWETVHWEVTGDDGVRG